MNETENQNIERQLTPEELEAIAGGGFNLDRMAKLGGVMHGRPEPNSLDLAGEVGGRIAQGGYILGQAFKGLFYDLTSDGASNLDKMADIQKNTMSRSEDVYADFKDSAVGKILGHVAIVVGTAVAGGAIVAGGGAILRSTTATVSRSSSGAGIPTLVTTPSRGSSLAPNIQTTYRLSPGAIMENARADHFANGGSFSSVPRTESFFSYDVTISGLQINQQSPIGDQLVGKSVGQFLSADELQQMNIPADARVVKYVGATDADADFVKEFKAASGLKDNTKLGYLEVQWSSNGTTVHDNVPLIDLGEIKENVVEETKPVRKPVYLAGGAGWRSAGG